MGSVRETSSPRWLTGPAPVLALVGLAGVLGLVGAAHDAFPDLSVYRFGGRSVVEGLAVYEADDPATGYPFTYPPFAAVAMVPLALVPQSLAAAAWTAASVSALAGVIAMARRSLGRPTPGWLCALLAAGALALEPVWQNLWFGQVNLLLMAAVVADLVRPERRWSGVLVGLAAGVKLTPLVFVVLLVLVGRGASAGRAVATFGGTVALGFLAMPGASAAYWTEDLVEPARVGPPALAHNQSAYGMLSRLLDGPPPTLLWLAVAMPLAIVALLLAVDRWRSGERLLATCLGAVAMLAASPVSWSHHWVWAVPVALVAWERSRWVALGWTAVFVARPIIWPGFGDGREHAWSPVDHLPGNGYLLAALALCVWVAVGRGRRPARERAPVGEPGGR